MGKTSSAQDGITSSKARRPLACPPLNYPALSSGKDIRCQRRARDPMLAITKAGVLQLQNLVL